MRAMQTATRTSAAADGAYLVQRCSCGAKGQPASDMCEECQEEKALGLQPKLLVGATDDPYEREADRAADAVAGDGSAQVSAGPVARVERKTDGTAAGVQAAPRSVSRAIGAAGEPLGQAARAFFEPRFGHDFGKVRVHRDAAAAASARDIAARAYTVGHHLVFGAGRYAPASREGRRLIAHELAHVIQQRGSVQRDSISPEPTVVEDDDEQRQALPEQSVVDGDEEQQAPPEQDEETEPDAEGGWTVQRSPLDGEPEEMGDPWPEKTEAAEITADTKAMYQCLDAEQCKPKRPLTWGDFKGTISAKKKRVGARIAWDLRTVPSVVKKCMPGTAGAREANTRSIEAFMKPGSSAAKKSVKQASNMKANGCAKRVKNCQKLFDKDKKKGLTGRFISMGTEPDSDCPASIPGRGDKAESRAGCATMLGKDCLDRAVAEAARLLKHEQGHMNLTCAVARKANAMIKKDTNVEALLAAAKRTARSQNALYDARDESHHGCNPDGQARWETAIAAGLPDVTIDVTARDRRRGQRRGRRRR